MEFTLGQAAKECGKSKPTLSKALASGKLSGTKNEDGTWTIQAAELFRVFPRKQQGNGESLHASNPKETHGNGGLGREVELLREQLDDRDRTISDLRTRLDAESEERRKLTAMLTDQRPAQAQDAPRKGLWSRLVGG